MKEYEIRVTEIKTLYIEAENEDDAKSFAEEEGCAYEPDDIITEILSVNSLDD